MKIFKFGGASVKDEQAIRTMGKIISQHQSEPLVAVVSAMGKTTNFLEKLIGIPAENITDWMSMLEELREMHLTIAGQLNLSADEEINHLIEQLKSTITRPLAKEQRYAAIVSYGELLSTKIVAAYLQSDGLDVLWLDARKLIRTDDQFMEGKVDWSTTRSQVREIETLTDSKLLITQGFIASNADGLTTTLGREGSDFSAAILASCLDAESVTVWKDVAGILNGDPKKFQDTKKYTELPYREVAEMTYYGASVIHPKTIKPLANHNIPLHVRSFFDPEAAGTIIHDCSLEGIIPSISIKHDQCLLSFQVKDYTFIDEKTLSKIVHEISEIHLKINLMQTSATSLSVCTDYDRDKIQQVIDRLKSSFSIRYNTGLDLITIKHYTEDFLNQHVRNQQIMLEQMSRHNYQALIMPGQTIGTPGS